MPGRGEELAGADGYAEPGAEVAGALTFFAEERPRHEVMFPDNEPRPYRVWAYMQDRRVRYFHHREGDSRPRFTRPEEED